MPSIKNIIIFASIGISLVLVYSFFIKDDGEEANLVTDVSMPVEGSPITTNQPGALAGQDFLSLLLNVKNIKLDDSIFMSPAFISLHDSSIILVPDGNEGRPNPFAPIGVDITAAPLPTTATPPSSTDAAQPMPPTTSTPPSSSPTTSTPPTN